MRRSTFLLLVWGWPIALGLISVMGLLSALLGDGWWDIISWVLLGSIVLVCLCFGKLVSEKFLQKN